MKSEKYYYICKRWKSNLIEIVHPRQARPSDKVLFEANYDDWNEFFQILQDHNMNPTGMHYKKESIRSFSTRRNSREWKVDLW